MANKDIDVRSLLPEGALLQSGKYRVEKYLSSGNFGNTYVVTHSGIEVQYVMKEFFLRGYCYRTQQGVHAVSVSPAIDSRTVDLHREKFKKEARRLVGLKGRHVVHVHDLFEENATVYYVMDMVNGESLADYMEHVGHPLSEDQVYYILDQLLDALEEVHQKQIWHLDLKPDNVMIERDGNVVLIDFGASKQLGHSGQYTGTSSVLCYTPGYAPLEQVNQNIDEIGPWTDLYALGATLYNLLTGISPMHQSPDALQFPATVSQNMHRLVVWLMSLNRAQRPQSVAEVRQFINASPQVKPTVQTVETPSKPKKMAAENGRSSRRKWWLLGGIAAAATVFLLVLVLALSDKKTPEERMRAAIEELSTEAHRWEARDYVENMKSYLRAAIEYFREKVGDGQLDYFREINKEYGECLNKAVIEECPEGFIDCYTQDTEFNELYSELSEYIRKAEEREK